MSSIAPGTRIVKFQVVVTSPVGPVNCKPVLKFSLLNLSDSENIELLSNEAPVLANSITKC